MTPTRHNFIAYADSRSFKCCDNLMDALEWADLIDGAVYEPLASDAARQVCKIETLRAEVERLRAELEDIQTDFDSDMEEGE